MKKQLGEFLQVSESSSGLTHLFFLSKQDADEFARAAGTDAQTSIMRGQSGRSTQYHKVSVPSDSLEGVMAGFELSGSPADVCTHDVLNAAAIESSLNTLIAAQNLADYTHGR